MDTYPLKLPPHVQDDIPGRIQINDPYDYLVDVLQRIGQHPASLVEQLTPRAWKTLFAKNPLRSDLYQRDKLPSHQ